MVYGTQITIVTGVYKPIYNWGAPHCTREKGFVLIHTGDIGRVRFLVQHEHRWSWPPCDRKVPDSWLPWKYHYMTVGNPPSCPFRYPPNWGKAPYVEAHIIPNRLGSSKRSPDRHVATSLFNFFAAFLLWLDGLSKWTRNLFQQRTESQWHPGHPGHDGISPGKVAEFTGKWSKPGIDHQIRGKCATDCEKLWINFPVCSGMCRKHWKPPTTLFFN